MRGSGLYVVVAGVLVACLGSAGSVAQSPQTTGILRGCRDIMNTIPKEPNLLRTCLDVVGSVLELGRDLKTTASCPPAGTDAGGAVSVVLQYADTRPDRTGQPFARLAAEALAQKWPCR